MHRAVDPQETFLFPQYKKYFVRVCYVPWDLVLQEGIVELFSTMKIMQCHMDSIFISNFANSISDFARCCIHI